MGENCRNCRFSKNESQHLRCRRYPPAVMEHAYGQGQWRVLQIVLPDDWCGEWLAMRPGSGLPADIAPPKGGPRQTFAAGSKTRSERTRS